MASLAAAIMAAPASAAVTYTWDTTGSFSGNSSQMTFSAGQDSNVKVKLRAYQISTLSSGSNTFQTASVYQYSGGLGISSQSESTSSPQHAIDNSTSSGRYEFLLVEFDGKYKDMGFEIGWYDTDSDIQVWVGNAAAGLNLASGTACNSGACDFTELNLLGFTHTESFTNVPVDSTRNVSGQVTGRYLLIAGRLANNDSNKDFFKISLLSGQAAVPEPSSLAIMAIAAAGVGFAGRRRRAA